MTVFRRDIVKHFNKEIKHLKVKTIEEDLKVFEEAFEFAKLEIPLLFPINNLKVKNIFLPIYKLKAFRCKSLNKGSRSGIRLIFIYLKEEDILIYVQIYNKNNSEELNYDRLKIDFKNVKIDDFKELL